MRDLDEHSITAAVLSRVAAAKEPRTREIGAALVRHLHAFVKEIEPTETEWQKAIEFLTATGQLCNERRQEFILLSDALGVSMLVDAINHRNPGKATETTVLGPFFVPHAPEVATGGNIAGKLTGPAFRVNGRVMDCDGCPVPGAIVDVWHADGDGFYDVQHATPGPGGRARLATDEKGEFDFWTVVPAAYPIPHDGTVGRMLASQGRHPYRPAHVHFMINAAGYAKLVTHLFLAGSDYLDSDVVFGVKESLIRTVERRTGPAQGQVEHNPDFHFALRADFHLAPEMIR